LSKNRGGLSKRDSLVFDDSIKFRPVTASFHREKISHAHNGKILRLTL